MLPINIFIIVRISPTNKVVDSIVPNLEMSLSVLYPKYAKVPKSAEVAIKHIPIELISNAANITDNVKPFKKAYPKKSNVTAVGDNFLKNKENTITTTNSKMANVL